MRIVLTALCLAVMAAAPAAMAQDEATRIPPVDARLLEDDSPITISPDGPALVQLNEDAASVIVGNPAHATAMVENPRLIMLMPGAAGATSITALNAEGKAILNRKVLVGGGKGKGYIRINRACGSASRDGCQPVTSYYCPGRCYETATPVSQQAPTGESVITTGNTPPPPPVETGPMQSLSNEPNIPADLP